MFLNKYKDYFIYYLKDPYIGTSGVSGMSNTKHRIRFNIAPRLTTIKGIQSNNIFKTQLAFIQFSTMLDNIIKFQKGNVPENKVVAMKEAKDNFLWSWIKFENISPSSPSIHNKIIPYFIYQNNCKRRIVSRKPDGYTIIAVGQLDFSKPHTIIKNINYASLVVDSRASGIIEDNVFSPDISFKIVDFADSPAPVFQLPGSNIKQPYKNVLVAYADPLHSVKMEKIIAQKPFTVYPSSSDNKVNFDVTTQNNQFNQFFQPYALRKDVKFRLNVNSFVMPTLLKPNSDTYDSPIIFICVKGLNDAGQLIVNKVEYRIIGLLNLSAEKRWNSIKTTDNRFAFTLNDDSLLSAYGQNTMGNSHISMSFDTNNYSDLSDFNIYLLNDKLLPVELGPTSKVPIINYTIHVIQS